MKKRGEAFAKTKGEHTVHYVRYIVDSMLQAERGRLREVEQPKSLWSHPGPAVSSVPWFSKPLTGFAPGVLDKTFNFVNCPVLRITEPGQDDPVTLVKKKLSMSYYSTT